MYRKLIIMMVSRIEILGDYKIFRITVYLRSIRRWKYNGLDVEERSDEIPVFCLPLLSPTADAHAQYYFILRRPSGRTPCLCI